MNPQTSERKGQDQRKETSTISTSADVYDAEGNHVLVNTLMNVLT